jgi:hypothetical protein
MWSLVDRVALEQVSFFLKYASFPYQCYCSHAPYSYSLICHLCYEVLDNVTALQNKTLRKERHVNIGETRSWQACLTGAVIVVVW